MIAYQGLLLVGHLTLAVLATLIRSSLAPPSGSCSACGDLLVGDATVADIAFRWGFTNLGRFARDYQDLSGENPSMTRRQPTL